jgi:hypothetical protein
VSRLIGKVRVVISGSASLPELNQLLASLRR